MSGAVGNSTSSSSSSSGQPSTTTLVVWAGEWPYVKRGISQVRGAFVGAASALSSAFDVPGYMATARRYTSAADRYVATRASLASNELQRHQWAFPAVGIAGISMFVVVKSAPWGAYKMGRNGLITAVALTLLLLPREVVSTLDSALPFGSSAAAAAEEGKGASVE